MSKIIACLPNIKSKKFGTLYTNLFSSFYYKNVFLKYNKYRFFVIHTLRVKMTCVTKRSYHELQIFTTV